LTTQSDVVEFPATESWTGTKRPVIPADGEGILRKVKLRPFAIERYAVTVSRFARFVEDTGYRTDAERLGWAFVFRGLLSDTMQLKILGSERFTDWWLAVEGACWKAPTGPDSAAEDPTHPATQISWNDATAFAKWAGARLPSEAEWEHAARSGSDVDIRYPWGDAEPDDETTFCNIWQGEFPNNNTCRDGFYGVSPVDAFAPNPAGLFNMVGNVWEWTGDRYRIRSLKSHAKSRNAEARREGDRVIKGGSFLCHATYCWRYRIAARSGRAPDTGASHTGFRLAYTR
jgi:formylglycine-generating enzyme required for sulfatase activity